MKSVLISMKPKWCELIASGKKTVEVRKSRPKIETPFKVYIYETKGGKRKYYDVLHKNTIGKVIGEFLCDKIIDMRDMGGEEFFSASCMTFEEWENYTNYTNHIVYGWYITGLKIYHKPKELSEFKLYNSHCYYSDMGLAIPNCENCNTCGVKRPPQSWCYVEELT